MIQAGEIFGRLTVLELVGRDKRYHGLYMCTCECGNKKVVRDYNLRNGDTKSCGCLQIESRKNACTTHGLANKHPLYKVWKNLKNRCYNSKTPDYIHYGAREIAVCDEWKNDFKAFYGWAMSNGWDEKLTIDRIDNDGDYTPYNCRMATWTEQQNNKRNNHMLCYNGESRTIAEWSREEGLNPSVLYDRISNGWDIERALTTPCKVVNAPRKGGEERWIN